MVVKVNCLSYLGKTITLIISNFHEKLLNLIKKQRKTINISLINTAKLSYVEADGSIKESYYKDEN
jgi:hypothetical protein